MTTTTLKRVLRLCILLMTLTTFTTVAKRQQYETFEAFDNATLFAAVSGCELCQQTDQCDQAFQSTLGQFCQTLVSCMTCCGPPDAHCVLDNAYNCRCLRTVASSNLNVRGETSATSGPVVETLVCIPVVASCMCCFSCCCLNNHSQQPMSYAQPVNTTIVYGTNGSAFGGTVGTRRQLQLPALLVTYESYKYLNC